MAVAAYRLVGPDPQLVLYLCDTEAELPPTANVGDTAYAKDTARTFARTPPAWIDVGPTPTERAALAGTVGVPGASNRFVTESDLAARVEHRAKIEDARWAIDHFTWPDGQTITPAEKSSAVDTLRADRIARTRNQ